MKNCNLSGRNAELIKTKCRSDKTAREKSQIMRKEFESGSDCNCGNSNSRKNNTEN